MKNPFLACATVLSAVAFAACAGGFTSAPPPATSTNPIATHVQRPLAVHHGPTLYVMNLEGTEAVISVYANGGASLLRSIDLGNYTSVGFATDGFGRLYASAAYGKPSTLNVYGNRGAKLFRTIQQHNAFFGLALDSTGNLFTMCGSSQVCEYGDGKRQIIRRLTGSSLPLALDASGDIAASTPQPVNIRVFAPGQTAPYWQIADGLDYTLDALAFDPTGNLYAAMGGESTSGSVVEYAPGSSIPMRSLSKGINDPGALAVDGTGKLYVYNDGSVTIYRPGRGSPIRTITDGIGADGYAGLGGVGSGLALDPSGNLYVADEGSPDPNMHDPGAITVYAPGHGKPIRTVTQGIQNPVAVAIGP